jgi:hypothetical protein
LLPLERGSLHTLKFEFRILILGQRERLFLDTLVYLCEEFSLKVFSRVDAFSHLDKVVETHSAFLGLGVMYRGLKHHGSIGQQIDTLSRPKGLRVVVEELVSELFHDAIDLLTLSGKPET